MQALDLSSLKKSITQLEKSLHYCASSLAKNDSEIALQFQAAAIQAFEFTYELSWKMLKRYLAMTKPNQEAIHQLSFPALIRLGSERHLLQHDWRVWSTYREARNCTAHTYDATKAEEVFAIIPSFLEDVRALYQELTERSQHL